MERAPDQPQEIAISAELLQGLNDIELRSYKELKTKIRDLMSSDGMWSDAFGEWMDAKLQHFGMIGKGIEAVGKSREKKNSRDRKAGMDHYYPLLINSLKRADGCPVPMEEWAQNASPDVLKQVGELMDYAANAYIAATTHQMIKKFRSESDGVQ